MAQHLKTEIKTLLASLNQFMTKLPKPKQHQYSSEIGKLVSKTKDSENDNDLKNLLKELQYRQNFLRLTNPKIYKELEKRKSKRF